MMPDLRRLYKHLIYEMFFNSVILIITVNLHSFHTWLESCDCFLDIILIIMFDCGVENLDDSSNNICWVISQILSTSTLL